VPVVANVNFAVGILAKARGLGGHVHQSGIADQFPIDVFDGRQPLAVVIGIEIPTLQAGNRFAAVDVSADDAQPNLVRIFLDRKDQPIRLARLRLAAGGKDVVAFV